MHIDNPFKQKGSLCILYFSLNFLKVIWWANFIGFFFSEHTLENVLREFWNGLWVSILKLIAQSHILQLLFFRKTASFLEELGDVFCMICWSIFFYQIWAFGVFALDQSTFAFSLFDLMTCFDVVICWGLLLLCLTWVNVVDWSDICWGHFYFDAKNNKKWNK